jgi:hypothetical protein
MKTRVHGEERPVELHLVGHLVQKTVSCCLERDEIRQESRLLL